MGDADASPKRREGVQEVLADEVADEMKREAFAKLNGQANEGRAGFVTAGKDGWGFDTVLAHSARFTDSIGISEPCKCWI